MTESPALARLRAAGPFRDDAAVLAALHDLSEADRGAAAPLALQLGYPRTALTWAAGTEVGAQTRAAAWLRLGDPSAARTSLERQPESARTQVLLARAAWQESHPEAVSRAEHARRLARQEGDAAALIAAATLMGEMQFRQPFQALRSLAEGLRVAEHLGEEADAHLLAVLALVQRQVGSGAKAGRTARKALDRSLPRSPARVLALLALERPEQAHAEAQAGELGGVWWRPF